MLDYIKLGKKLHYSRKKGSDTVEFGCRIKLFQYLSMETYEMNEAEKRRKMAKYLVTLQLRFCLISGRKIYFEKGRFRCINEQTRQQIKKKLEFIYVAICCLLLNLCF